MGKDSFPGSEISIELVGRQSQWVGNSLRFPQSNSVLLLTHSGSKHAESHAAMCLCGLRSSFAMASYGFDLLLWTACYFKNFLRLSCSNFGLRTWRINYGKSTRVLAILATCSDVCLINSVSQTTEGLADFIAVYYLLVSYCNPVPCPSFANVMPLVILACTLAPDAMVTGITYFCRCYELVKSAFTNPTVGTAIPVITNKHF